MLNGRGEKPGNLSFEGERSPFLPTAAV